MRHRRVLALFAAAAALVAIITLGARIHAFINPDFTPIHLIEQSEQALVLKFDTKVTDGKATAKVVKALKGEAPKKPIIIDLMAGAFEAQGKAAARIISGGSTHAIIFMGAFEVAGEEVEEGGGGGDEEEAKAKLHVGGKWIDLLYFEEQTWDLVKINNLMEGTWAGSTDMLQRCVEYILDDEDADVPVTTEAELKPPVKIGSVPGRAARAEPIDLDGKGSIALYVRSAGGDRVFAYQSAAKAYKDVTAPLKLASASRHAAWGNFDGKYGGGSDLVTSDGKTLKLQLRQPDGTFAAGSFGGVKAPGGGVVGLGALDGGAGRSDIVISTKGSPVLLTAGGGGGSWSAKALVEGDVPAEGLGRPLECLVADFDGDAVTDVLQPFQRGGLFYKGAGPGRFAAPVKTRLAGGEGIPVMCVGDYDQDGLLDVFASATDINRIWQNLGGAKFVERRGVSGEINYIAKKSGVGCQTCDVNNDGRQDVLILLPGMEPQIFFNRGFRSFGHSHQMDIEARELLEEATEGTATAPRTWRWC